MPLPSKNILAARTISDARRMLRAGLTDAGIENAIQEADFMLCRLLNCAQAFLLAHPEKKLDAEEAFLVGTFFERRLAGIPLQYILEETDFWGRPFSVGPRTLIPRPETELLVEAALELLPPASARILDWGSGSGCIGITMALERPGLNVLMAEKNPLSLIRGWRNIDRYSVQSRCLLWHSRTPDDIPVCEKLDAVVSNPPYIPSHSISTLMREVRDHEPRLALDGGSDGLDCYRLLFRHAADWLRPGGILALEIGGDAQVPFLLEMGERHFTPSKMVRDLHDIARCMVWTCNAPSQ